MHRQDDARYARTAIVGTGKVAQSLGRAMAECGWTVDAIAGRDPERTRNAAEFVGTTAVSMETVGTRFEHAIIAVSDGAIESVAAALARTGMQSGIAVHTSGSKGSEALSALSQRGVACASMHPLQTIAEPESGTAALRSCYFALTGAACAIEFADTVARCIGAKTFCVDAANRPLYHSAAVLASNYVCGLLDASVAVLESIGISRDRALDAIRPLFEAAARNSASMGPEEALTGPIARGDVETVHAHVRALAAMNAEIAALYGATGLHVVRMAQRRGLSRAKATEIAAALTISNA
jgi:predicted short-subunit dehydrogenase-like oxidoreductase (DUF2520 family)